MADAIARSAATGVPAIEVLHEIARDYGRAIGDTAVTDGWQPPADARSALDLAGAVLTEHGYEPRHAGGEL
jgi:hypothetical protein